MTVGEAYRKTKDILTEAGFEAPAFEALCLTEKVFGFNRLALITKGEETVASEEKLAVLAELTEKRLNHEPLQYLLGKWSFMGIDLLVGEGVLVPRDDTEVVTSLCIDYLSYKESPNVIDLCAGSGAISLALEKYANCKVTAVELSDKAFSYLTQNIKLNNSAVNALNGDIFECHKDIADNSLDLIVSNPPYIKTADIAELFTSYIRNFKHFRNSIYQGLNTYFTSLIACHFCIRACSTGNSSTSSQNYDFWFPHHLHLPQYHFSKRIYETISVNTQPTAQTVSIGLAHNIFHHILYF